MVLLVRPIRRDKVMYTVLSDMVVRSPLSFIKSITEMRSSSDRGVGGRNVSSLYLSLSLSFSYVYKYRLD